MHFQLLNTLSKYPSIRIKNALGADRSIKNNIPIFHSETNVLS